MKTAAILSIVAAFVIGCVLTSARGQPNDRGEVAQEMPFKGAILVVELNSDPAIELVLRNPAIKTFAEREFLVGVESAEVADNWQKDHVIWTPIDNISQIAEFADGNEVIRAKKAWKEAQGEDLDEDLKRLYLQQLQEKLKAAK